MTQLQEEELGVSRLGLVSVQTVLSTQCGLCLSQSEAVTELLRHYSMMGKTISECVPLLGRSVATLKAYARAADISFPDYKKRVRH